MGLRTCVPLCVLLMAFYTWFVNPLPVSDGEKLGRWFLSKWQSRLMRPRESSFFLLRVPLGVYTSTTDILGAYRHQQTWMIQSYLLHRATNYSERILILPPDCVDIKSNCRTAITIKYPFKKHKFHKMWLLKADEWFMAIFCCCCCYVSWPLRHLNLSIIDSLYLRRNLNAYRCSCEDAISRAWDLTWLATWETEYSSRIFPIADQPLSRAKSLQVVYNAAKCGIDLLTNWLRLNGLINNFRR